MNTPLPGESLFREWDLYDRIVHDNWMAHREIAAAILGAVRGFPEPVAVLDLGSGDGEMAARCLAATRVRRYVGVDLSESALERLARRAGIGAPPQTAPAEVVLGDMARVLRETPADAFDLVLASYSLHHFPTDSKHAVLDDIVRVLRPEGRLIWTDVVRDEDESRDDYLRRLTGDIDARWLTVPPADRRAAIEHILAFDFPETEGWMHAAMVRRASTPRELYRDSLFGCWVYE